MPVARGQARTLRKRKEAPIRRVQLGLPAAWLLTGKVEIQVEILNPWRYAALIVARPADD